MSVARSYYVIPYNICLETKLQVPNAFILNNDYFKSINNIKLKHKYITCSSLILPNDLFDYIVHMFYTNISNFICEQVYISKMFDIKQISVIFPKGLNVIHIYARKLINIYFFASPTNVKSHISLKSSRHSFPVVFIVPC